VSARASSANIDTAYVAAYAGTSYWAWNFRSGATFAWNTIGTSSAIAFPSFFEQATTRYGAGEAQVFGELGLRPDLRCSICGMLMFGPPKPDGMPTSLSLCA
jgi:uncharacterized protein with beta-barrel porin domain